MAGLSSVRWAKVHVRTIPTAASTCPGVWSLTALIHCSNRVTAASVIFSAAPDAHGTPSIKIAARMARRNALLMQVLADVTRSCLDDESAASDRDVQSV